MADEGKLSRALSKAGTGERLGWTPETSAPAIPKMTGSATATVAPAASAAPAMPSGASTAAAPRRVAGKWSIPDASLQVFHQRESQFSSQIRGLRGKVLAMNHGRPPRVIMVTSGSRTEGKTTVSLNLAAALCEVDPGRVLVVDGDFLGPAVHVVAGVQPESGLNDVLANDLKLDGHIHETAIPNLDILPARAVTSGDGIESSLHQRAAQLVASLRRHYSFVIIDTPPVLASSHATALAKISDGVVIVAKMECTPRHVVQRAAADITHVGGKIIGCVLTHHKHHVPNSVYRMFGNSPNYYGRYGYQRHRNVAAVDEGGNGEAMQPGETPGDEN